MAALLQLALFTAGLAVLYVGAEMLVKGAVRLATSFGVSRLIVGLSLVAFGTSAPELALDVTAAFRGAVDLAFGDLVGSNIANVGLVVGVAALVRPMRVQMRMLRSEIPIVIAISLGLWVLSADGNIGRGDAILMLGGFAAFVAYLYRTARRERAGVRDALEHLAENKNGRLRSGLLAIGGLATLVVGAQLMVIAAVAIARDFGVSELVIGLTIVAIGTSLPELATAVVAAYRGDADLVVGNVLGSNVFNILMVMALVALIHPLPVQHASFCFDIPVMAAFAVGLGVIMFRGLVISRWEGGLLLVCYAAFIVWQAL
ncbi:MAG: calcium/sodium antiporter [Planctomycetes bacterium]|nr:calcium/sodium antiporter [Planctomycetota bacterium]MBU4400111.1 calcium/sodium antiporter [Planctomycetota bacterium]MCG2682512.1 calcium/sodium antiporter [Planctomycetales bacterium]